MSLFKKGIRWSLPVCLSACLTCGCTLAEFPENGGVDPTAISVKLVVKAENSSYPSRSVPGIDGGGGLSRRVIAAAYLDHELVDMQTVYVDKVRSSDKAEIEMLLHARNYQLVVWSDFVEAGTMRELYYASAGFPIIGPADGYAGNVLLKDGFSHVGELDLTPYADEWDATVSEDILLERVTACYELRADDSDLFLQRLEKGEIEGECFTVRVTYAGYYPDSFDAYYGIVKNFGERVSYSRPFSPDELGEDFLLACDCPLADEEGESYPAAVEIVDEKGNAIARTSVRIPCERGKKTVVRSDFLTSETEEGIHIDTDFDGVIEIEVVK